MNSKVSVIACLLGGLIFVPAIQAGEHHAANALEHAAVAASHAEKGHLDLILEHSKEALHHAKMSAQEHHNRHMHMESAVTQLNQAIEYANKQDSEKASKAAHKALEHIHKSFE